MRERMTGTVFPSAGRMESQRTQDGARATPKISQPPLPGPWAAAYRQLSPQLLESSSLTEAPAPASVYFWSHS